MHARNAPYSADPSVAARHVIGRLLDLSHVSWRTYVADLLTDHKCGGGAVCCAVCRAVLG
jgi:hypothetical protein